jgi:hypothetical protein
VTRNDCLGTKFVRFYPLRWVVCIIRRSKSESSGSRVSTAEGAASGAPGCRGTHPPTNRARSSTTHGAHRKATSRTSALTTGATPCRNRRGYGAGADSMWPRQPTAARAIANPATTGSQKLTGHVSASSAANRSPQADRTHAIALVAAESPHTAKDSAEDGSHRTRRASHLVTAFSPNPKCSTKTPSQKHFPFWCG